MRVLEEKFGSPHPALEGFKEPRPEFSWLVDAFFRLHRRRQHHQNGFQPLSYQELADFAAQVLKLPPSFHRLFFLTMEETDNAVLFDHYTKTREEVDKASARNKKPKKPPRR